MKCKFFSLSQLSVFLFVLVFGISSCSKEDPPKPDFPPTENQVPKATGRE